MWKHKTKSKRSMTSREEEEEGRKKRKGGSTEYSEGSSMALGDRVTWFLPLGHGQWTCASASVDICHGHKSCLYNNVHIFHSSFEKCPPC